MALHSPRYPDWDEEHLRAAIIYYYMEQHYAIRKIASALKLGYQQVRRVLLTSADVETRERVNVVTETQADGSRLRRCKSCGDSLPLTDEYYHRDKTKAGGFGYTCKGCRRHSGEGR